MIFTAYVLLAMWGSFITGSAIQTEIAARKAHNHPTQEYRIDVDYNTGHTHTIREIK